MDAAAADVVDVVMVVDEVAVAAVMAAEEEMAAAEVILHAEEVEETHVVDREAAMVAVVGFLKFKVETNAKEFKLNLALSS
jgi:predicted nucleic acid-binding protein